MPHTEQINDLFMRYLEVCNEAMKAHGDEFPFKHIWEAAEKLQQESGFQLAIYDDEPKAQYQVCLKDKHIDTMEGTPEEGPSWRLNTSYLRQVVENPQDYIDHPTKLDWDWLKNRIGL